MGDGLLPEWAHEEQRALRTRLTQLEHALREVLRWRWAPETVEQTTLQADRLRHQVTRLVVPPR